MKLMKARKKKKMNCKRFLPVIFLLFSGVPTFADSFADAIQDLAVVVACKGKYNNKEFGLPGVANNYYKEERMADRFAQESGENTMTTTFYGICFNYAQFAFTYIQQYKSWYNEHGMYESQFWLAGVHDNPNQIELMSIGTKNDYSRLQNGVYIKTYDTSLRNVKTHNGATEHAWLWIERADGVWFWIDPTWTDTEGYVFYGYVKNGQEIQCKPDKKYCEIYPSYLNNLPSPPPMGKRLAPSKTSNSINRQETIKDAGTDWLDKIIKKTFNDVDYSYMSHDWVAFMISADVPFNSLTEKDVDLNKLGLALEFPILMDSGIGTGIVGFEYLHNLECKNNIHAFLVELDFARRLFSNIAWFLGGGIGLRFDFASEGWVQEDWKTSWIGLKANTGFIVNFSSLFTKIEVSYNNVYGFSVGVGIGLGIQNR